MNRVRQIACALGGLTLAMLLASSPAMSDSLPPASWMDPPIWLHPIIPTRLVGVGGMPGWHIALIAAGAALIAATLAVTIDHARAAHQQALACTTRPPTADAAEPRQQRTIHLNATRSVLHANSGALCGRRADRVYHRGSEGMWGRNFSHGTRTEHHRWEANSRRSSGRSAAAERVHRRLSVKLSA